MWTALSLWLINGVGLALYAAIAARLIAQGAPAWPFVIALPLLYLGLIAIFVTLYFVLAWWFRAKPPPETSLTWRQRVHMYWREYVALVGSAPRMMFYRLVMPDPPSAPADRPLLLMHGVLCNAGVWNRLARFLKARGIGPIYALSYGPPLATIEHFADQMRDKIEEILGATGAPKVVVVAHSMGGLVTRAYLRKYGGAKIARVITLATPYRGSVHAYLVPGQLASQLRPDNPYLNALDLPADASMPPIVSLWSWHDSMVAPQTSSRLDGAENIPLTGVAHNALLGDPRVFEIVLGEIEKARTVPDPRAPRATPPATSESPALTAQTTCARR